jgi:hypothetical protein
MADGSTTSYNFTLPEVGASEDTWGTKLNANWSLCDDLLDGTTAIAPNLTLGSWKVGGIAVTATAAELNILDGVTATAAELNYVDGVTSSIQTQIDNINTDLVNDTTPQLGGDLDGQGNNIYSLQANIGSDSGDYIKFTTDTRLDVYVNGSNEFRFEADGDFHADGDVVAYSTTTASDERLKENIVVVEDAVAKCNALRGVTFDWIRDGSASAGVIAQDVQQVLPEAVKEVTGMNGDTHLTVNYGALTSILIEAVKTLSAEVEALKGAK